MTLKSRGTGILMHPTSLPGVFGIGDLGAEADAFVAWAAAAGQSVWQVLPLGPTGPYHSPYVALSTFAGNPFLVSPRRMADEGLLATAELEGTPRFAPGRAAYRRAIPWKEGLLRSSWGAFGHRAPREAQRDLEAFVSDPAQAGWLDDWALFMAIRLRHGGIAWTDWEHDLHRREPAALERARRALRGEIEFQKYLQFLFFRQWMRVKAEANRAGLRILGDLPIYVAPDSADVWANQTLFRLDAEGRPVSVAGVPPDYFSDTGQRWGNPLYRWDRMEADGFAWWVARVEANLRCCDLLRLDHFRGFAAYWEIPASELTAVNGRWEPGPGAKLFAAIRLALGDLPLVAEDLGLITPDVHELRNALGLPGMRVLQFAFDGTDSWHLPRHHPENAVVYTGTHDNDTTRGWFASLDREGRARVLDGVGSDSPIEWAMIRAAYGSPARLAVAPLQDVLGLGSKARTNTPGRAEGNWAWRAREYAFDPARAERLRRLAEETGRLPAAASAGRSSGFSTSRPLEPT